MMEISRIMRRAAAVAAVGLAIAVPASAHYDEVRYEDPGFVAARLHKMGFLDWRRLKWDHGYWKVDDARRDNGHVYDLKIEAGTFDLVRLEREGG